MYQTRKALINYLNSFNGNAVTIKKYEGEIQEAKEKKLTRLRVDMPAIFVLLRQGQPLSELPVHQFFLYFITQTKKLSKEESEKEALQLAEEYMVEILDGKDFNDSDTRYSFVNLQNSTLVNILNDHVHTILEVPIEISVDRA